MFVSTFVKLENIIQTRDFCAIEVRLTYHPVGSEECAVTAIGCSWRHPGDPSNKALGYNLALSRALKKASAKLEKRMDGYVKHQMDMGGGCNA